MRALPEIEARIRHLVESDLRRRLAREVLPQNCRHNHRQPLDHRRTVYGEAHAAYNRISIGVVGGVSLPVVQTIGLCMLGAESPGEWAGTVCEDPIDAQRCPQFADKQDPLEVYQAFARDLQNASWLESHLPEVSSLLWVIGAQVSPSAVQRPWWARLWSWFLEGPLKGLPKGQPEISVYLPPPPDVSPPNDGARTPAGDRTSPATL
jgi:hypothetical protein